ncbi:hypothetical protein EDD36DRAFT_197625 [Exophiala viscosa]|uniref:Uncharacterized protein n=1 Tax=Exophiala viscosa TaxID=2486360 RepID=A0AAN6E379_9EURO|nr:hypothetical protein EDD36DRAFT_197625 [Exophiala viscosa]
MEFTRAVLQVDKQACAHARVRMWPSLALVVFLVVFVIIVIIVVVIVLRLVVIVLRLAVIVLRLVVGILFSFFIVVVLLFIIVVLRLILGFTFTIAFGSATLNFRVCQNRLADVVLAGHIASVAAGGREDDGFIVAGFGRIPIASFLANSLLLFRVILRVLVVTIFWICGLLLKRPYRSAYGPIAVCSGRFHVVRCLVR